MPNTVYARLGGCMQVSDLITPISDPRASRYDCYTTDVRHLIESSGPR